jgi:hypothetical protein
VSVGPTGKHIAVALLDCTVKVLLYLLWSFNLLESIYFDPCLIVGEHSNKSRYT